MTLDCCDHTIVVGLLGPAGAGKSSVAEHLMRKYGAERHSLAAPLKEIAKRTLNFTDEQMWGTQAQKEAEDPRYGFSPRWFLQRLGTEGCRAVLGEDVWTKACLRRISLMRPRLAVIDDVRFVDEATAIRAMTDARGVIWRLEAPSRETQADATHASESEWQRAPHDIMLAPLSRGLELLFSLVDDACRLFGITRASEF